MSGGWRLSSRIRWNTKQEIFPSCYAPEIGDALVCNRGESLKVGDEKKEEAKMSLAAQKTSYTALYPPRLPPPETVLTIFRDQSRSKYGRSRIASE